MNLLLFLAGFLCCTLTTAFGATAPRQQKSDEVHGPVVHHFEAGGTARGIPFRFDGGNIRLSARINDSPELDFVFDTGVPGSGVLLFKNPRVDSLRLREEHITRGSLSLPGAVFPDVRLRQSAIDMPVNIAGLLGPCLLGSCVVEIDFAAAVINLYDFEIYEPGESAQELPLIYFDRTPFIEVPILPDEGNETSALCALDLGSSGFLHLYSSETVDIKPTGDVVTGYVGTGVDGPMYGMWARVPEVLLGNRELTNVLCAFSTQRAYPGYEHRLFGNIGNGILSQFKIAFDYRDRCVYLEPIDEKSHRTPFPWPSGMMCGKCSGGGLEVIEVFGNTAAADSGIVVGDTIISINGKTIGDDNHDEALKVLSEADHVLEIVIKTNGKLHHVSLEGELPIR